MLAAGSLSSETTHDRRRAWEPGKPYSFFLCAAISQIAVSPFRVAAYRFLRQRLANLAVRQLLFRQIDGTDKDMPGQRKDGRRTRLTPASAFEAPRIVTERLVLRAHNASDFDASLAMWSDEDVVRHIGGVPSSAAESWSRLLRYGGLWRFLGYGYWAVEDRATGRFVGEVGFADFKRDIGKELDGMPEAGWVISPNWAGQGYATEAMRAALQWFDQAKPGSACFCMIAPENTASIRVAAKLGYKLERETSYKDSPIEIHLRPPAAEPLVS